MTMAHDADRAPGAGAEDSSPAPVPAPVPVPAPARGGWLAVAPPLSPGALLPGRTRRGPFPLDRPEHRRYLQARHGLHEGLRALGLGPGDEVLVPAWHHGSEVEAIVRAGLSPIFYDAAADLVPDAAELEGLLTPRTRALHLIHYLGFPQDADAWRTWCDERGLFLVEDAAQAWLSTRGDRPTGSRGDLAIFSLYKSEGFPHGGALMGPPGVPVPPHRAGAGLRGVVRRSGAFLVSRSGALSGRVDRGPRSAYDAAQDFALGEVSAPGRATEMLLGWVDLTRVAERRRARYAFLLERLGDQVPDPFRRLPPGASPFAFPVVVDDKAAWLGRLARSRIRATDLWSVPHPSLPVDRFPGAARRRAETLLLPVHQHLRRSDLERIARAVTEG